MTQIADVMRRNFITVAPEDTLGEVTERDLLKAMAGRVHTSEARVREWMTPDPITASPEMTAEEAAKIMLDNGFRHLPVVDSDGLVAGVVSLRQVAAAELGVEPELA